MSFFDVMAQVGAEIRCLGERLQAFGFDLRTIGRDARECDPELARISAHLLEKRPVRSGCDVWIAGSGTARCVEQRCRVAYGQRHRVLCRDTTQSFASVRRQRIARSRWFQPHDPAAGRRHAD